MPHIGPLADFGEPEGWETESEPAPEAPLFVRPVTTRSAMPWDQARAATLEARMNAPLPIAELAWQLRRLEPWKPGAPGRYAAIYARREDVGDGLSAVAVLDGRSIPVQFLSQGKREEQAQRLAIVGTASALAAFLFVSSAISVVAARARANAELEQLEATATRRLGETRAQAALSTQSQAIAQAGLLNHRASRVLDDLAWTSQSKAADVGVEGFIWEAELFAVLVRGDGSPFAATDRKVERSSRPVRPGVWLWGVSPATGAKGTAP